MDRFYKHNYSFKCEPKRISTKLSNFTWGKKKEKVNVNVSWSILVNAKLYSPAPIKYIPFREVSDHFFYTELIE